MVDKPMKPMLDEGAAIGRCTSIHTQPHFERCERTGCAEPSLCYDDGDGEQVRKAKPQGIDPPPGAEVAGDRENEASNDEHDDGEVEREHRVREQKIELVVAHFLSEGSGITASLVWIEGGPVAAAPMAPPVACGPEVLWRRWLRCVRRVRLLRRVRSAHRQNR